MLRGASFFQFTFMGAPIIYYGDELGMEGGADPDNRRPMHWDRVENNPTRDHFRRLATLRATHEALRTGAFRTWYAGENGLYAYERFTDGEQLLCVLNTSTEEISESLPLPRPMRGSAAVHDLYADRSLPVWSGLVEVRLAPGEGLILE